MKIKIFCVLTAFCAILNAQGRDSTDIIPEILDKYLISGDETDIEAADFYNELLEDPIRINTEDFSRLDQLPFITYGELVLIKDYILKHSPLFSAAELYMVKNIPVDKIKMMLPFIITDTLNNPDDNIFSGYKVQFRSRFKNDQRGSINKYLSAGLLNRFIIDFSGKFKAGIITEKDIGEKKFNDLTSAYIQAKLIPNTNIVIGDFNYETGAGLLFGSAYRSIISSGTSSLRKKTGFYGHSSSGEISFFRGFGLDLHYSKFRLNAFISSRLKDAVLDSTGDIKSFIKDGYHRTESELKKQNSISEISSGGSLMFETEKIFIGTSISFLKFSGNFLENKYFNGLSFFSNIKYPDIQFFGEAAFMRKYSALTGGLNIEPSKVVRFETIYRYYDNRYLNFYGSGHGSGNPAGTYKNGFFTGITIRSFIDLKFYLFQYSISNKEQENSIRGNEIFLSAIYPISDKSVLLLVYKMDRKSELNRINLRCELSGKFKVMDFRFRGDFVSTSGDVKEKGLLLMNDINYHPVKNFSFQMRNCFFRTDSFFSAIYEYESGITGLMDINSLFGEGLRSYLAVRFSPENFPSIGIKLSQTFKKDEEHFDHPEVIMQMDYYF